jgi:3-deoxy-D-manno-octulosonic acid kinase
MMLDLQSIREYKIPGGFIGTHRNLNQQQVDILIELVCQSKSISKNSSLLGGRTNIIKKRIYGLGSIVLKPYARGGVIHFLSKDRYVNTGNCRAATEYALLGQAMDFGINVPVPIAYVQKGRLFYRCWSIIGEVENFGTLAGLSQVSPEALTEWMPKVSEQIQRMIDKRIFHIDLHPGNVLAGKDGRAYLIDFDKARISKISRVRLKAKYMARWERAIQKYRLNARSLRISL